MQEVLIKSDLWEYVCGKCKKPETETESSNTWVRNDLKARSEIILPISPTKLKQVKHCETSQEMWMRLEEIYQSKEPTRNATLLKVLTLHKIAECNNVREHLANFFEIKRHGRAHQPRPFDDLFPV